MKQDDKNISYRIYLVTLFIFIIAGAIVFRLLFCHTDEGSISMTLIVLFYHRNSFIFINLGLLISKILIQKSQS